MNHECDSFFFLQQESSSIKQQLLEEFLPDDICPLGASLIEIQGLMSQFSSKDYKSLVEVII